MFLSIFKTFRETQRFFKFNVLMVNLALGVFAIKTPENWIHAIFNGKFYFLESFFNVFTPSVVFSKRTNAFGIQTPNIEIITCNRLRIFFDKNHGLLLIDFKLPEGNLKCFFYFFTFFDF